LHKRADETGKVDTKLTGLGITFWQFTIFQQLQLFMAFWFGFDCCAPCNKQQTHLDEY
jgi:hypothetical protein